MNFFGIVDPPLPWSRERAMGCGRRPGRLLGRGDGDTAPSFTESVADQTYTLGAAINTLTRPAASGGNGALSYSLQGTGTTTDAGARGRSGAGTARQWHAALISLRHPAPSPQKSLNDDVS